MRPCWVVPAKSYITGLGFRVWGLRFKVEDLVFRSVVLNSYCDMH